MIESFYEIKIPDFTDESLNYKWSPAEVNQILFRNFGKSVEAIKELEELNPSDLYGFTQNKS